MQKITSVSESFIAKIKKSEGFKSRPYPDPGTKGRPFTIGYGTTRYFDTGKLVTMVDKPIDEKEGDRLLRGWFSKYVSPLVDRLCRDDLTQDEFDAIADFVYNAGATYIDKKGNVKYFNLFEKVNNKVPKSELQAYWEKLCITGGGHILPGLITRRKEEVELYF
ncbi:lysozyme [Flavobacterium aquiphilum]|uniref:lysozyme n=1 Tax=Flavobacterium aquiphilum TaxID=3003261 RepID=UPI002480E9BA|nr:lysozyme [Flavobacterium aquiphilum]